MQKKLIITKFGYDFFKVNLSSYLQACNSALLCVFFLNKIIDFEVNFMLFQIASTGFFLSYSLKSYKAFYVRKQQLQLERSKLKTKKFYVKSLLILFLHFYGTACIK